MKSTNEQELREKLYGISFLARADSETGERTYSFMESELLEAITAHTNAEIAKVLDRLEAEMNRYTAEHDVPMRDEAIDAIQAERAKLKEVK